MNSKRILEDERRIFEARFEALRKEQEMKEEFEKRSGRANIRRELIVLMIAVFTAIAFAYGHK